MRKSIRIARIVQIIGIVLIVTGITQCMQSATSNHSATWGWGLALILGARAYEWLTKE